MSEQKTILHIEDDQIIVSLVSYIFRKNTDYCYVWALDGPAGFDLAIQKIPDLIIMDIYLPTGNGVEWSIKLKNHPVTQHIPIIVLTAGTATLKKWNIPPGTFETYLRKPIIKEDLLRQVHQYTRISDV